MIRTKRSLIKKLHLKVYNKSITDIVLLMEVVFLFLVVIHTSIGFLSKFNGSSNNESVLDRKPLRSNIERSVRDGNSVGSDDVLVHRIESALICQS